MQFRDDRILKAKKAVVALSGGVDSAHAALFLKSLGLTVIGVYFKMFPENSKLSRFLPLFRQEQNIKKAEKISKELKIDFMIEDVSEDFEANVIDYFVSEYLSGRTPNPCVFCNPQVKMSGLTHLARILGADIVATGHYARVVPKNGSYELYRAVDRSKDQSYYLYRLNQETLAKIVFPNGYFLKTEVKKKMSEVLKTVSFPDESQEVCFIEKDYRDFILNVYPEALKPGPIVLKNGKVVGTHKGIAFYTVGQRKGLNISLGKKYYVIKIEPENNLIVVGTEEDLYPSEITVEKTAYVDGKEPEENFKCKVKVRYRAKEADCVVEPLQNGKARVKFLERCGFPAPGQSAVFYLDEKLIGGGIIEKWL